MYEINFLALSKSIKKVISDWISNKLCANLLISNVITCNERLSLSDNKIEPFYTHSSLTRVLWASFKVKIIIFLRARK